MEYKQRVANANLGYWFVKKGLSINAGGAFVYENSRGIFRQEQSADVTYEKFNIRPSASISYRITKKYNVNGGYDMGILRPDFSMLNPYVNDTDPMNLRTGNPYLDPELSHNFSLGTSYSFVKGTRMISLRALYSRINNAIEQVVEVDPTTAVATTIYANIGKHNSLSVKLMALGIIATKMCNLMQEVTYNYVDYTSGAEGARSNRVHGFSASTTFVLRPWRGGSFGFSYSLSSDVGSPQLSEVHYNHAFRGAFWQTLVKNRLWCSVEVSNPFESRRYIGRSLVGANFRSFTRSERRGRIFGFSIQGNFGHFRDRVAEREELSDDRNRATIPDR